MYLLEQFINLLNSLWSLGFQLVFIIALYLIPIIIEKKRKTERRVLLTSISILLGWTFIVWLGCIAWAVWGKKEHA